MPSDNGLPIMVKNCSKLSTVRTRGFAGAPDG